MLSLSVLRNRVKQHQQALEDASDAAGNGARFTIHTIRNCACWVYDLSVFNCGNSRVQSSELVTKNQSIKEEDLSTVLFCFTRFTDSSL